MFTTQCNHDVVLIGLSYLVSVLGSLSALQLAVAIPAARNDRDRLTSIALAGVAMGGGAIWSMHFIAMLACRMDMPVTYGLWLTVASAIIGVVACMVGLGLAGKRGVFSYARLAVAAVIMGLGVSGMHYSGMAAMVMPATTVYNTELVAISVAIGILASAAALWLAFNLRGMAQMMGSALVMGVAVCGMHYTGMAAASFVPNADGAMPAVGMVIGGEQLGLGIFAITCGLLAVLYITNRVRERQRAALSI